MMKAILFVIALLAVYAYATPIPHTACSGSPQSPLADSETASLSPPVYVKNPSNAGFAVEYDPDTLAARSTNYAFLQSNVDSTNVLLSFVGSQKYANLKMEMISPTDTPLNNEIAEDAEGKKTYPCNGYFGFPLADRPERFLISAQKWSQVETNFCGSYYNSLSGCYRQYDGTCCGCSYTQYIQFKHDVYTGLGNCFNRTEDDTFYYYDTIVQSTYSVFRPQIRNKPVVRSVLGQSLLRFRFRRVLSVDTGAFKSIFVGGLRQVYLDIIRIDFLSQTQQVYFEVFTSVQWPYKLFQKLYRSSDFFEPVTVDNAIADYNPAMGYEVVNKTFPFTLQPNTTSTKNCGLTENSLCEQVWSFYVSYPSLDPENADTDFCRIQPTLNLRFDVGCTDLYLDSGANCTVGEATRYSDHSFATLPLNDFCVDIVQNVELTATIYPFVSLAHAMADPWNSVAIARAVYSYVYGGPVYYRVDLTPVNRNAQGGAIGGTTPTISNARLTGLVVRSGLGANFVVNVSDSANGFQQLNFPIFPSSSPTVVVFGFVLNQNTVTLANFDSNQQVDVVATIRVNFNNIASKDFDLENNEFEFQQVLGAQETSVTSQFYVSADTSSAAASSSMNVVAVAAGSAAGIVALTVVVAFMVHRRSMKQFIKAQSQPPTSKELEEANESTSV